MASPPAVPAVRGAQHPVTIGERDAVVEALCAYFANGDLPMSELERRLEAAFRARNGEELNSLLSDLLPLPPDKFDPGQAAQLAPPSSVPPRGALIAVMGGAERSGGWIVPRHMKVFFLAGGVSLDLRTARLGPGVTEIELTGFAGGVEIIVPPGVRVEFVGTAFMAGVEANAGDPGAPGLEQPILRISGFVMWGSVSVSLKSPKTKTLRRFDKAWRSAQRLTARTGKNPESDF